MYTTKKTPKKKTLDIERLKKNLKKDEGYSSRLPVNVPLTSNKKSGITIAGMDLAQGDVQNKLDIIKDELPDTPEVQQFLTDVAKVAHLRHMQASRALNKIKIPKFTDDNVGNIQSKYVQDGVVPRLQKGLGKDNWDKLPPDVQADLTSLTFLNYGPKSLAALKKGIETGNYEDAIDKYSNYWNKQTKHNRARSQRVADSLSSWRRNEKLSPADVSAGGGTPEGFGGMGASIKTEADYDKVAQNTKRHYVPQYPDEILEATPERIASAESSTSPLVAAGVGAMIKMIPGRDDELFSAMADKAYGRGSKKSTEEFMKWYRGNDAESFRAQAELEIKLDPNPKKKMERVLEKQADMRTAGKRVTNDPVPRREIKYKNLAEELGMKDEYREPRKVTTTMPDPHSKEAALRAMEETEKARYRKAAELQRAKAALERTERIRLDPYGKEAAMDALKETEARRTGGRIQGPATRIPPPFSPQGPTPGINPAMGARTPGPGTPANRIPPPFSPQGPQAPPNTPNRPTPGVNLGGSRGAPGRFEQAARGYGDAWKESIYRGKAELNQAGEMLKKVFESPKLMALSRLVGGPASLVLGIMGTETVGEGSEGGWTDEQLQTGPEQYMPPGMELPGSIPEAERLTIPITGGTEEEAPIELPTIQAEPPDSRWGNLDWGDGDVEQYQYDSLMGIFGR